MFGRTLARFVTTLSLLAASVAWMGWIYLHTVADPTRSDRIAHAILDDARARHEVAVDISNGLASATRPLDGLFALVLVHILREATNK